MWGSGFGSSGLKVGVKALVFRVWGRGFGVSGSGVLT